MNAIDFLIKEHEKVRHILAEISDNSHRNQTRMHLFDDLCHDLLRHEEMEHQVWYPHFKNDKRLSDTVQHLVSEENKAEKAIAHFQDIQTQEAWEKQFNKLKHDVEHHAQEEEQNLFPEVRKLLSEEQLEKIGIAMYHFKQKYDA